MPDKKQLIGLPREGSTRKKQSSLPWVPPESNHYHYTESHQRVIIISCPGEIVFNHLTISYFTIFLCFANKRVIKLYWKFYLLFLAQLNVFSFSSSFSRKKIITILLLCVVLFNLLDNWPLKSKTSELQI